jgi:hypothetical protein
MLIVPAVLGLTITPAKGLLNLLVGFPDIRIWFWNARQIPPRRATACNTQEKTAGGRCGNLNQRWGMVLRVGGCT